MLIFFFFYYNVYLETRKLRCVCPAMKLSSELWRCLEKIWIDLIASRTYDCQVNPLFIYSWLHMT